ncbi:MAG: hypothetical protein WC656_03350 [Sulfurimonas sp.]
MFKILSLLVLLFVFNGCMSPVAPNSVAVKKEVAANQKAFEQEDSMILFALRAEQLKEYATASEFFNTLYLNSHKKEYLYRSLQSDLIVSNNEQVIKKIDSALQDSPEDLILVRLKIIALIQMQRLEEAQNIATDLVNKSKSADDFILLSDIYVKLEKFDMAMKYLESAYAQDYNEKVLDKMVIVLYVNLQRKTDAIAQLETHIRMQGCSELICARLLGFYSNENNVDGLLSTYLRLYKMNKDEEVGKKIVQIYGYKKDFMQMTSFLEENEIDNATLLQLYSNMKDYIKAFPLADKLYADTGEIEYLGQSAIYEYESAKNKSDKNLLKKIAKKFDEVVKSSKNPLYFNYYGYILIDHDVDVNEGIKYVKKALEIDSNSLYYIDSLAWGYYKLGHCTEADALMKKVVQFEGANDPEVLLHKEAIEKCIKTSKEVKK